MKKAITFVFFIICMGRVFGAFAIPPSSLLTNNFGILSKHDIENYVPDLKPRSFTTTGPSGAYIYWQCFPREFIVITLEDTGFSSDDFGWKDNIADLKIRVTVKPDFAHQYNMSKRLTVTDFEKKFNRWRKLMHKEQYVCLAGSFMFREHKIDNGKEREIYQWNFEALKTKSGCDSYLYSCIENDTKRTK